MKPNEIIPKNIKVNVYWVLDEEDNIVFDFDLMREEFESKLKDLKSLAGGVKLEGYANG